jgi:hypothetical protein
VTSVLPGVYLESTIPSYLAARPSRDIIVAAHQQITWEWWETARDGYELFVSDVVLAEIKAGDPRAAARRLEFVEGVTALEANEEVLALAREYQAELLLPPAARRDILHVALAVLYEVDYLLTWNCTHLANGHVIRRLIDTNTRQGRFTPMIVTPDVLLGKETGEVT